MYSDRVGSLAGFEKNDRICCQSYLKERRRPPTGGLGEAGGVIGGKGFHALVPCSGSKGPWSLGYLNSPYLGKTMDTARDGMTPIGVVSVGASRCGELERVD